MSKRILTLLLVLVGFALPAPLTAAHAAVTPERVVSDKGIVAWLVRDPTIPVISLSLTFRGGGVADPAGKAGTANMVSGLLDEGAGDLPAYEFQKRLEDLAIHLRFDAGRDNFSGSLKTLVENQDAAFDMLRLALASPRFDAEPVERIRSQILVGLRRELEDPDSIAQRAWFAKVFPDHPYGTPVNGTPESVKAITPDDLRAYVRGRFARDALVLGVVGDITPEKLKPLLDKAFGDLPEKAAPLAVAEAKPRLTGEVMVEQRNIPQSVVVFGEDGFDRNDPDWYAAYILNYILGGGGFSSILMEEVREKRGLAYGIYTYLQPFDYAPMLGGTVATANARVAESLDLVRAQWSRIRDQGPSEEQLRNAKTYLTGSFPLQLTSTGAIAGLLVAIQLDDLGLDYLEKRNGYIEAVTLEDTRRVAQRLFDPAKMTTVVVGAPQGLKAGQ